MAIRVERLDGANDDDYLRVLADAPQALLYSSPTYRLFLERVLPAAESHYFVAYEDDLPTGVLPSVMHMSSQYGPVLNSLPFYGSNGGVTVSAGTRDVAGVYTALLDRLDELAGAVGAVACTVISNPLDDSARYYEARGTHAFRDDRIGQLTALPTVPPGDDAAAALMAQFHQKTRNAIRKAAKSDIVVTHTDSIGALEVLAELHRQNIAAVGGFAKPWEVFAAIRGTFAYDRDYRVYVAERGGETIAALLVFFHHGVAEYFTPATHEASRSLQPMSLLVHDAMNDAVRRGCRYWNWGGTWRSQSGVYQFKSRWGTRDFPYYYYSRLFDPDLLRLSASDLLREYEYFYVLPFDELTKVQHAPE